MKYLISLFLVLCLLGCDRPKKDSDRAKFKVGQVVKHKFGYTCIIVNFKKEFPNGIFDRPVNMYLCRVKTEDEWRLKQHPVGVITNPTTTITRTNTDWYAEGELHEVSN
jgi:hypothetical protein